MIALFRCDASARIGIGHVMRSLAFADTLAWAGWTCVFATRRETLAAAPALREKGYAAHDPDQLEGFAADIAIVDHYGLDAFYERRLRRNCSRVAVFDDLADRDHACTILVDPTPGRRVEDYRSR